MGNIVEEIAKMIDLSLLGPTITDIDLTEGCQTAKKYGVASVCVKPYHVRRAKEFLKDSSVKVGTVIGFPHGSHKTEVKVFEAEIALEDGAEELDMVINIGALISGDLKSVERDIKAVADTAHSKDAILKVIFENCYLNVEQKISACKICEKVRVDFIKTSTGFGTSGYTADDIKLMRTYTPNLKLKAAHGVRTLEHVIEVKKLGCNRFGTTQTTEIIEAAKIKFK